MTEPSFLTAVRKSYDTVAADYVERVPPPAEMDPLSRAMLAGFAEMVRTAGPGEVADLGCGPGRITAHLAGLGVPAFGVDLSPRMVELARNAYPDLRFTEGSMTALDTGDDELGGILAWYSTHHTPPRWLPEVFAEFHRTLAPGGFLLWGDYVGDEHLRPTRRYGRPVSYESYFLPVDHMVGLLDEAGLVVTARLEQEPGGRVSRPHACLLAHKPDRP
ncbi:MULTISPECIES: class I SAM-dependent methyltransferase [unclassified Streptomyces]|uniref:class I SAM-dependent methyltransferase n=1 Tax=unclassified Streptomyces TaxID=2593676 RepID=UPI000DBA10EF|nr:MULTISPECIES: class I SAM-dependent methyltransferase [unclassified Streptomyces]MYT73539.1 methyltransferase domain-containing protein [Streptomyces sp. SID8367]RAJ85075.1 methyltransferase family protein [Streptomyces sp. PsTaAH-137]